MFFQYPLSPPLIASRVSSAPSDDEKVDSGTIATTASKIN